MSFIEVNKERRKIDRQSALVMREEGKTLREIGKHFGVSHQAVFQMLKVHNPTEEIAR